MVYDETPAVVAEETAAVSVPHDFGVDKPEEEQSSKKQKESTKRGKKGGRGKKRKKPPQSQSGDSSVNKTAATAGSTAVHPSKQQRVERDPYEWTESQSNKTPTPLKMRRGADTDTTVILPRRRLNQPDEAGQMEEGINVGAGTSTGGRQMAGDEDKQKDGAPKDTTPSKEAGDGGGGEGGDLDPSKQQTPPVRGDDHDRSHDRSGSGGVSNVSFS